MIDVSAFSFDEGALNRDPKSDFIAQIPAGSSDRNDLFQALSQGLQFPYFGNNWDALRDLLSTFGGLRVIVSSYRMTSATIES